eukprot:6009281-Prymnesium_polylepis.1
MCEPVANPQTCRESANLSRICREPGHPVANLCANPVENFCESVANLANLRNPGGELSRIRRES